MRQDQTFFDIHMHAMDLSHPNLLAFLNRINGLGMKLILGGIAEPLLGEKEEKMLNLLTVMENSIEDYFCLMEYFLKTKEPVVEEGAFHAAGTEFRTILITPLIMDFGLKHIQTKTFYDVATGKPVVEQSADILRAIAKYCNCQIVQKGSDRTDVEIINRNSPQLFEIYPFMGMNTRNYELPKLKVLLDRCFGEYTGHRSDLLANMGKFGELEAEVEYFRNAIRDVKSNVFAGIKVYPPLGFDPWPVAEPEEMEKVRVLYELCQKKRVPITAHCNDGGFAVVDNAQELTNPVKWEQVLSAYPDLKLNLAHFGKQENFLGLLNRHEWREKVIELIFRHDNVYTDISCLAFDDEFYGDLAELLEEKDNAQGKLSQRILFGSDYMINLQWIASYNEYLSVFLDTTKVDNPLKLKMCNTNPVAFLFNEA